MNYEGKVTSFRLYDDLKSKGYQVYFQDNDPNATLENEYTRLQSGSLRSGEVKIGESYKVYVFHDQRISIWYVLSSHEGHNDGKSTKYNCDVYDVS